MTIKIVYIFFYSIPNLQFSVTRLSPGVTYTINVTPYNKRYVGMKYTIVTKTEGMNI